KFAPGTEARHVDTQRVALPSTPRIAPPLMQVRGEMRAVRQRDDTLPGLSLPGVVEDRHAAPRLHDLREEAGAAAEVRQTHGHTPLAHAAVFRTVGPIEVPGGIMRRSLQASRRWRPIGRAPRPLLPVLAGIAAL